MSEEKHTVKIHFPTKKSADNFLTWLCEGGEQDYWSWMEFGDPEEDAVVTFDYWHGTKEFAKDLEVHTEIYENFFKDKI